MEQASRKDWTLPAGMLLFYLCLVGLGLLAQTEPYNVFSFVAAKAVPSKPLSPSDFTGLETRHLFLWAWNHLLVFVLGASLLRVSLPENFRSPFIWVGGYWLGYLGVCAIGRVLELGLTAPQAYAPLCLLILFIGYRVNRGRMPAPARALGVSLLFVPLAAVLLVMQVYEGDFQWVGHGTAQYALPWSKWVGERLPIIAQHYDEFIFHSFIVQPLGLGFNAIYPWWVTLAIVKCSVLAFLILALPLLGLRGRGFLAAAAAFLFAGTSSILPDRYFMLFDSSNPFAYTVHSGRTLAVPLALFAYLWLRGILRPPAWAQFILGVGAVTTSLSNWGWMLGLAVFEAFAKSLRAPRFLAALIPVALVLPPLLYLNPAYLIWANVAAAVAPVVAVLALTRWREWPRNLWRTFTAPERRYLFAGIFVSALLLGNLFAVNAFADLIDLAFVNLTEAVVAVRPLAELIGDHRELVRGNYDAYCYGFLPFVCCYGFYLWILGTGFFSLRGEAEPARTSMLALLILSLTPLFFIIDFVGISSRAWVMTRFLEVPLYLGIMLGLTGLSLIRARWPRYAVLALILFYVALPLWGSDRGLQWLSNWNFLKSLAAATTR